MYADFYFKKENLSSNIAWKSNRYIYKCLLLTLSVLLCSFNYSALAISSLPCEEIRFPKTTKTETYSLLRGIFSNCSSIYGNLDIRLEELPEDSDLTFLNSIEKVTGYVRIQGRQI